MSIGFVLLALIQTISGTTTRQIASFPSPNQQWHAVVYYVDPPSMFSIPSYTVELEPKGWFPRWRGKHLFSVMAEISSTPPQVHWRGDNLLYIDAGSNLRLEKISPVTHYRGISIAYEDNRCANSTSCYNLHGRLRVQANMKPYLWPVGTKRLLAIAYRDDSRDAHFFWPSSVEKKINPDVDLYGDFEVCPMTTETEDIQQPICIESASHLVVRERIKP